MAAIIEVRGNVPVSAKAEIQFSETVRVTKLKGRKSKQFIRKETASSSPPARRVFIAQIYGEVWIFSQRGTRMMRRGRTTGPWPTILPNVEAKKRWTVLVIDDAGSAPPTRDMLIEAEYFDCPADCALPLVPRRPHFEKLVGEMEALQEVGRTNYSDERIRGTVQQLLPCWDVSDSILWNSQHFSLHLAASILTHDSFNTSRSLFVDLSRGLWVAANTAETKFMLGKHIACMVGMGISGVVTFGVGAVGFWGLAGASMGRAAYVETSLRPQIDRLGDVSWRFQGWAWFGR